MANGKAPGPDSIPVEIYKYGGQRLVRRLVHLFSDIWQKQSQRRQLEFKFGGTKRRNVWGVGPWDGVFPFPLGEVWGGTIFFFCDLKMAYFGEF